MSDNRYSKVKARCEELGVRMYTQAIDGYPYRLTDGNSTVNCETLSVVNRRLKSYSECKRFYKDSENI